VKILQKSTKKAAEHSAAIRLYINRFKNIKFIILPYCFSTQYRINLIKTLYFPNRYFGFLPLKTLDFSTQNFRFFLFLPQKSQKKVKQ
jgi:hypothetical protein